MDSPIPNLLDFIAPPLAKTTERRKQLALSPKTPILSKARP